MTVFYRLISEHAPRVSVLLALYFLLLPASAEEVTIGAKTTRQVRAMGQSWQVPVYATSSPGVVMIPAEHAALDEIGRALGKRLLWSPSDKVLNGEKNLTIKPGQKELLVNGSKRELPLPAQVIDGVVHVPGMALEGLLECRLTVKTDSSIYIEPVLQSISFSDAANSTVMHARTSVPVRKKVFQLSNPPRTVVDLVGVAIPEGMPDEHEHPVLGTVRVGQFELAPSVTRIVLPSAMGVSTNTKRTLDLFEHQLTVNWPAGTKSVADLSPGRAPAIVIPPTKMPERAGTTPVAPKQPAPPTTTTEVATKPAATKPAPAPPAKKDRITLSSVEWQNNALKLTFSEPVRYSWSRVNTGTKRYVIDFPDVVFPERKKQLTSSVAGLQQVRIVQNMPEPHPIVRLVCDLDSPIAVDAEGADERVLYLRFPGRTVGASELPRGIGHTSKELAASGSAKGRTVVIDPGHGGSDPGAVNHSYGISEKQITLDISLKLANYLKAQGWNVIMTRTNDRDVSWAGSSAKQELGARANVANVNRADLFVSVHINASVKPEVNGTSIHWYKASDYRLASLMEQGVMSATGRTNRGLIKDRFYVLAHTEMPAVLIEAAFLSNSTEAKLLSDPEYRDRIARGIASGLEVYAANTFVGTAAKN